MMREMESLPTRAGWGEWDANGEYWQNWRLGDNWGVIGQGTCWRAAWADGQGKVEEGGTGYRTPDEAMDEADHRASEEE